MDQQPPHKTDKNAQISEEQAAPSLDLSLSQSFDGLSMDEDFMNFLLDGAAVSPVGGQRQPQLQMMQVPLLGAMIKSEPMEDPHLAPPPSLDDSFAFNEDASEEAESRSAPVATSQLPPPPPTPPTAELPANSFDDPFGILTSVFPLLGDLTDSNNGLTTTSTTSSSSPTSSPLHGITATTPASSLPVSTGIKKEEDEDFEEETSPKRKTVSSPSSSTSGKPRSSKKQKTEPDSGALEVSEFIRSLRGMNSAQLEHYAETHTLTDAQQAELKEWIRKIKNRESASLSRRNRKNHQQELEGRIEALDTSNSRLREQITELQIENRVLMKELEDFKSLIEKSNLGQAFAQYNVTKKIASTPTDEAKGSQPPRAHSSSSASTTPARVTAAAAAAAAPEGSSVQLSDVILKAMSGGKPNKEGMALVLYLLMALHSYGQYWSAVTSQHQQSLSQAQPQPQPDEVTAHA